MRGVPAKVPLKIINIERYKKTGLRIKYPEQWHGDIKAQTQNINIYNIIHNDQSRQGALHDFLMDNLCTSYQDRPPYPAPSLQPLLKSNHELALDKELCEYQTEVECRFAASIVNKTYVYPRSNRQHEDRTNSQDPAATSEDDTAAPVPGAGTAVACSIYREETQAGSRLLQPRDRSQDKVRRDEHPTPLISSGLYKELQRILKTQAKPKSKSKAIGEGPEPPKSKLQRNLRHRLYNTQGAVPKRLTPERPRMLNAKESEIAQVYLNSTLRIRNHITKAQVRECSPFDLLIVNGKSRQPETLPKSDSFKSSRETLSSHARNKTLQNTQAELRPHDGTLLIRQRLAQRDGYLRPQVLHQSQDWKRLLQSRPRNSGYLRSRSRPPINPSNHRYNLTNVFSLTTLLAEI